MNREIKFRIWYPEEKRMVFKGALTFDMKDGSWLWEGRHGSFHSHFGNLMQFTGLKDKNGKEIYEGDIVSDGFEKAVVSWFKDECQFLAFNEHELSGFNDPQVLGDWAEVIGNIYENPELVK